MTDEQYWTRVYRRQERANLRAFGLSVHWYHDNGEFGLEDCAQVNLGPKADCVILYQGPASRLGAFIHGLGWGSELAERIGR